jgi:hypothetical protein
MAIVTIQELKDQFVPGQKLSSEYFQNLVDTLADDRSALHVGLNGPTDGSATPLWFNNIDGTFSIFNGADWVVVITLTNYNMPKEDGLPGQVLSTDGHGNLSWKTIG